jgi:hypothetical protein
MLVYFYSLKPKKLIKKFAVYGSLLLCALFARYTGICVIMPTVIVIDVSLSMTRPVFLPETGETHSHQHLAVCGINILLDYLAVHSKLEFVSLVSDSSQIIPQFVIANGGGIVSEMVLERHMNMET